MNRNLFAGCQWAIYVFVTTVLLMTFAGRAVTETMTDRCSGDVSFPSAYDGPPVGPGTLVLTRGHADSGNWTFAMHQTIDSSGHIRWWCHSTTGNWADPGTWTVDDAGATYVCGSDGEECTLSIDASGHPVDTAGWTAERSRCDSHSSVFRARLGANRLLQIDCLDENTRTGAQRLVGEPDVSAGGFGTSKPAKLSITFAPVQRAPVDAWYGNFVYPRGLHLNEGRLALTISPNSVRNRLEVPLTRSSYRVSVTEKQSNPLTIDQIATSVSPRSEARYVDDYFKPDLSVGSVKVGMTTHDISARTVSSGGSVGLHSSGGGTTSDASHPVAAGNTAKPTIQAGAARQKVLQGPTSSFTERADSMVVSPEVTLMLYSARGSDGRFSTYAIRYLHRKGDRVVSDVMLIPAVEAPH